MNVLVLPALEETLKAAWLWQRKALLVSPFGTDEEQSPPAASLLLSVSYAAYIAQEKVVVGREGLYVWLIVAQPESHIVPFTLTMPLKSILNWSVFF